MLNILVFSIFVIFIQLVEIVDATRIGSGGGRQNTFVMFVPATF